MLMLLLAQTTIRIRFPDRTQLEKIFPSTSRIKAVYAFVRERLRDDVKPIKFILCAWSTTEVVNVLADLSDRRPTTTTRSEELRPERARQVVGGAALGAIECAATTIRGRVVESYVGDSFAPHVFPPSYSESPPTLSSLP